MWSMVWPIALVVLANTLYNICTKSTPSDANAFASLTVTYLAAAVFSAVLFLTGAHERGLAAEIARINWSSLALGVSIVALEFGYISIYRAGWKVSEASLVANISLACVLLLVGLLAYKETITLRQVLGMLICAAGLALIAK